jgi:sulfofructose kinase
VSTYDVYAYGVVASSTLYSIQGAFPEPEGYAEIDDVHYMTGGEATNASIVLSGLGARVKLDGNWLGATNAGRRTKSLLDGYNIDTSSLPLTPGYEGAREVVFAAESTRTIFGSYGQLLESGNWNRPKEKDIVVAKVVCVDPFFGEASAQVAAIAAGAGIPAVTVDCLHDDALLGNVAAVVVSESFLRWKYPGEQPEDVFRQYLESTSSLVIFTFGDRPIWYGRTGQPVRRLEPYAVKAVDTSGAGDAFRAGVAYGFLRGWDNDRTVDFSAALAAIVCTRSPGVLNAPGLDEVIALMGRSRE